MYKLIFILCIVAGMLFAGFSCYKAVTGIMEKKAEQLNQVINLYK